MELKEALFYRKLHTGDCECALCPRRCRVRDGEYGFCMVRRNIGGVFYTQSYGRVIAANVDPIEKKPLADWMPGTNTFSVGTFGCNLDCRWCQNDTLSRGDYREFPDAPFYPPEQLVKAAVHRGCPSISYTYNEPAVFAEFVIDAAAEAHRKKLKNVLVTNGYVTPEAAVDLYRDIDAANFDVKGFSDDFYRRNVNGELAAVLASVKYFYSLGKHLELTMLVIPTLNDDLETVRKFIDWVKAELSVDVVLHFSAFHPAYRCMNLPPTPPKTLFAIRDMAAAAGIKQIKLGNLRA